MMEMLKASFRITVANWRVSLLFYVISLLLTAFPLFFFYNHLVAASQFRFVLNELVAEFDYALFSDFMNENKNVFRPVLLFGLLGGFLGSLVYTFLSGGAVLRYMKGSQKTSVSDFFHDSARLFPRYLLLLILLGVLLFCLFLICGVVFFIFALLAEGSSERGYVLWLLPPFVLLALSMSFGLCVSLYAKVFIASEWYLPVGDAFWKAFSYVFNRPQTLGFFWILIGAGALLGGVYLILDDVLGMTSAITMGIMLIIQQVLVFFRFFLKNWNYALATRFFSINRIDLNNTFGKKEVVVQSSEIKAIAENNIQENIHPQNKP